MRAPNIVRPIVALGLVAALAPGCLGRSAEARYYTMSPADGAALDAQPEGTVIAVAAVSFPRYLERPQIVTRTRGPELVFEDLHRWAGGFEANVHGVLVENLATRLPRAQVGDSSTLMMPATFRVSVDVLQFDGRRGDQLILRARWTVRDEQQRDRLFNDESTIREPVHGGDIGSLIEAHDRALARLADAIAARIATAASGA